MKFIISALIAILSLTDICQGQANRRPTIDRIPDYGPILENSGEQTVEMTGITSGGWETNQTVTITAWSENLSLIDVVHVDYQNPSRTGNLKFTPLPNANGTAKIVVRLDDGMPSRNITEESFKVTVTPVNGAPTFKLSMHTVSVQESSAKTTIKNFAINIDDGDPELNQKLSFTLSIETVSGNLTFKNVPEMNANNGELIFELQPDTSGEALISAILHDDGGTNNGGSNKSDPQNFKIIVKEKLKPPTLNELKPLTILEDSGEQSVELSGISPGGNNDQTLIIKAVSSNPALITGIKFEYVQGSSTGTLLFSPASNKFGSAVITVTLNNGLPENNLISRDMLVTIEPVADTPSSTNATTTRDQQTKSGLVISRNPVDGTEVTHFKITAITNGTLYQNNGITPIINNGFITFAQGNAGLKFTPVLGGSGNGSFKIQAATGPQNNNLGGNVITAIITIDNKAPVITSVPDTIAVINIAYVYMITATDANPGDVLRFTVLLPPAVQPWLTFTNQSNGTGVLSGTPPTGTIGQYAINIKVSDQNDAYAEQAYTLRIITPNQKPVLNALSRDIYEDDTLFFSKMDFVSRFSDPDGDTLTFWKVVNDPLSGSLFVDGNPLGSGAAINANQLNKLIYVPDQDYYGFDVLDWNASDGRDYAVVNQRVNIMITAVNDPPELVNLEKLPVIYEFGEPSVAITDSATVVDVDDDRLQKMTLRFTGSYYSDEDSIYLPPTNSLASVWEKDKGMLTITGYLSTEIYEVALRSTRYVNVNNLTPKIDKRKIEIMLYDRDNNSLPYIREIEFENSFVNLVIPSGFTPNQDGVNDTWYIGNLEHYEDMLLAVYSRTGKKIFESRSPNNEWDGTNNGSAVPAGVYYYYIMIHKFEKVYTGALWVLK
jgi:gliding motility-associated-like protein